MAIVLGAQLLVVPPANYVPEGWTPPATTAGGGGQDFTPGQMLKTMQFLLPLDYVSVWLYGWLNDHRLSQQHRN